MAIAGELRQPFDHHRSRRHVDSHRQGLGGEHDLDQTLDEAGLDGFAERRDHPRVMGRDPTGETLGEPVEPQHGQVTVLQRRNVSIHDRPNLGRLLVPW